MTPGEFAAKWRGITTSERAAAQSHFIDLCRVLGEPDPHRRRPGRHLVRVREGCREARGGDGFADVWKRGFFAWEYKGKRKDLRAAYLQLQGYRDALENPPLLVVSDLDTIEIRTNFTNLSPVTKVVTLDDLAARTPRGARDPARRLHRARGAAPAPSSRPRSPRRPPATFAELAFALRARGHDPQGVAHFLDRILFCLFAEDAGMLPKGVLSRLAEKTCGRPDLFGEPWARCSG